MRHLAFLALFLAAIGVTAALGQTPTVTIQVDATADMHPINPNVYGLNQADRVTLDALNSPLNRFGGNRRSRYNWQQNVDSTASDFFFESFPDDPAPGGLADTHVLETKNANGQSMITVPMIDFIAKTDGQRSVLCSFSVAKYGPQAGVDVDFRPDCGNGIKLDGTFVINQVDDANTANSRSSSRPSSSTWSTRGALPRTGGFATTSSTTSTGSGTRRTGTSIRWAPAPTRCGRR